MYAEVDAGCTSFRALGIECVLDGALNRLGSEQFQDRQGSDILLTARLTRKSRGPEQAQRL